MLTWRHRALIIDENPAPRSCLHCATTNFPFRMVQAGQRPTFGTRRMVGPIRWLKVTSVTLTECILIASSAWMGERHHSSGLACSPGSRRKRRLTRPFASHLLKETDETWRPFHPRVTAAARSTIHTRAPCARCGRSTGSGHASFIPPVYTFVSQIGPSCHNLV